MDALTLNPLTGIGTVNPGDDLAQIISLSLSENRVVLREKDVVVLAQKIVSKAEGRYRRLSDVRATTDAIALANKTKKDARLVQLVLDESSAVIRACPGVLITRNKAGFVMANAGIDASNLNGNDDEVLLLPENSDASATNIREAIRALTGVAPGIVISDSFGRPWREGVTNVAIGVAGIPALLDKRQHTDRAGRSLQVTQIAVADLVASAAGLLMGEGGESIPAVHVRGIPEPYQIISGGQARATDLVRPVAQDLFT